MIYILSLFWDLRSNYPEPWLFWRPLLPCPWLLTSRWDCCAWGSMWVKEAMTLWPRVILALKVVGSEKPSIWNSQNSKWVGSLIITCWAPAGWKKLYTYTGSWDLSALKSAAAVKAFQNGDIYNNCHCNWYLSVPAKSRPCTGWHGREHGTFPAWRMEEWQHLPPGKEAAEGVSFYQIRKFCPWQAGAVITKSVDGVGS